MYERIFKYHLFQIFIQYKKVVEGLEKTEQNWLFSDKSLKETSSLKIKQKAQLELN